MFRINTGIKRTIGQLLWSGVTAIVAGIILTIAMSILADVAPYLIAMFAVISPLLGLYNLEKKNKAKRLSDAYKKMKSFGEIKKGGYVLIGICFILSLPSLVSNFAAHSHVAIYGLIGAFLVWEGIRIIQKKKEGKTKKKVYPNFLAAVKASW